MMSIFVFEPGPDRTTGRYAVLTYYGYRRKPTTMVVASLRKTHDVVLSVYVPTIIIT